MQTVSLINGLCAVCMLLGKWVHDVDINRWATLAQYKGVHCDKAVHRLKNKVVR